MSLSSGHTTDPYIAFALCHAMKEEMARLFDLRDGDEARNGWTAWFEGARASGIPALVRFAELKEKRIDGLIAMPPIQFQHQQASLKDSTTGLRSPRGLPMDIGMRTISSPMVRTLRSH